MFTHQVVLLAKTLVLAACSRKYDQPQKAKIERKAPTENMSICIGLQVVGFCLGSIVLFSKLQCEVLLTSLSKIGHLNLNWLSVSSVKF